MKREVTLQVEPWPTKEPFCIAGYTFTEANVLIVTLKEKGKMGRGEASGVYYLHETGETMLAQAEAVKQELQQGLNRQQLQQLLPSGGARNAIDSALWDLETKLTGKTIWQLTGIEPTEILTVNTIGIGTPESMAIDAKKLDSPKIKVKLDAQQSLERIKAVCAARPDAEIVVDVNQAWSFEQLQTLAPMFKQLGITMIEQPLKRGGDAELEHYRSPIPLCADESCLDTSELEQAARRYQMINIKLDKTGGLTEALKLAKQAKSMGLGVMMGCRVSTSLGIAPAVVVAQYCELADLDGPTFLTKDRPFGLRYERGLVSLPSTQLWG